MKNLIRIPLTLALLFAICGFCPGQEFYRGELFVTGQHFSLTDGHLTVELSVDFENLQMPSDESLTVTPVLKSGESEQELPSVLINGAEKQKVYQRTLALSAGKRNGKARTSPIPAVVIRDDAAVSRAFTYKVSIPYEPWMEQAVLLLRSQECACHGRKGDIYEDKIADGLRLPKLRGRANLFHKRFLIGNCKGADRADGVQNQGAQSLGTNMMSTASGRPFLTRQFVSGAFKHIIGIRLTFCPP